MLGRKDTYFLKNTPNKADSPRLWFCALQFHLFTLELLWQLPLSWCRSLAPLQSQ